MNFGIWKEMTQSRHPSDFPRSLPAFLLLLLSQLRARVPECADADGVPMSHFTLTDSCQAPDNIEARTPGRMQLSSDNTTTGLEIVTTFSRSILRLCMKVMDTT